MLRSIIHNIETSHFLIASFHFITLPSLLIFNLSTSTNFIIFSFVPILLLLCKILLIIREDSMNARQVELMVVSSLAREQKVIKDLKDGDRLPN